MSFSNPFFIIATIVLLTIIAVGLVVILIMKKKKVSETKRSVTSVIVVFAALLLSGLLVYTITMNMMYDLLQRKLYTDFTFDSPDKSQQLLIKEYSSSDETGFEVYDGEKKLGAVSTSHYLPFEQKEYEVDWAEDHVILYFTYENTDDRYICKSCRVNLKEGTVSESAVAQKDLSKLKAESREEASKT